MDTYPQRLKLKCNFCLAETYVPVDSGGAELRAIAAAAEAHEGGRHGVPALARRDRMTTEEWEQSQS